jgi:hypothetical protein
MGSCEKGHLKSNTWIDPPSYVVIRVSEKDNAVMRRVGVQACLPPACQSLIAATNAA